MQPQRIVRLSGLKELTKLSGATIYRLIAKGEFPRQFRLSAQAVGWDLREVDQWLDSRKLVASGVAA